MATTTAIGYQHNLPVSDPASLTARTIELGSLGAHDLVVEIEAVSVNPVDVKLRTGAPAEGFRVLGFDAAGVVREVGEAVELFAPGDEVFYAGEINRPGSNQHLQLVDERIVGRKPRSLVTAHSEGQIPTYAEIVRAFGQITAIDDGPRDVAPLKGRSITWHWELMFTRSLHRTSDLIEQHRILERVASLVDDGKLITTANRAFTPISAATLREAHALVESGHTMGKVVLHGWE